MFDCKELIFKNDLLETGLTKAPFQPWQWLYIFIFFK